MARTPMMHFVLGTLRTVRGALAAGIPPAEYAALRREQARLHRRDFLRLTAGTAGALALTACGGDPDPSQRVVVVGGGMAGLHCAYRLNKLGVSTFVYDAAKRFGGRMFTDRTTFPEGQHCELGGELIDTGHVTMHDLAAELGIELLDYLQDDTTLAQLVAWFGGRTLTDEELLRGFEPIALAIDGALGTMTDPDAIPTYRDPNGAGALDALSIRAWLDQQDIPTSNPARQLLEVAYTGEFGLETDVSNSLNLLTLISTDTTRLELFGESDERFHAKEGNDTFTQKLADALDASALHLERRLTRLESLSDGRYRLSFEKGGGGTEEVTADHVVLALPFTLLREVDLRVTLPDVKRRAIAELGYGTNSKLMVGFSSRPWRTQYRSDGSTYTDVGYMQTWETSRLQPGQSGIITNFVGGQKGFDIGNGTPEQQAADFIEGFNRVFPGVNTASNGRVSRMVWPTYPLTKGSYAAYKVGQYTTVAGSEIERVGNLHFCGEHTSLDAQGYMEGAALTGAMAAAEVAADLGVRTEERLGPGARILERARLAQQHGRWLDAVRLQRRQRRAG
ncbi:flavin monoamine oxidase family protein [Myxococcus sp. Y35]|uniref:flavin monoamine oxidase family protein n=1 Tax=Pseudomyxococcus flavus TaxID=3115648 RepID=UPI003CE856E3